MSGSADEATTVDGLRAGNPAVFEQLLRTEGPRLVATARRILGNDDDAREAVHEGFISAFRARGQFRSDARISTWLHRIVVNTALMKLRARRRHPEASLDDLLPRFLPSGHHADQFQAWPEPADAIVSRREVAERVRAGIDDLPETYRTVLLLRDIEGLSTGEAASALGISPNAAKLRLHRARLALRTLLAPVFEGKTP